MKSRRFWIPFAASLVVACEGSVAPNEDGADEDPTDAGAATEAAPASTEPISLKSLPVGDGKYKATPAAGYIFSCQQNFSSAAGAFNEGPWINAATNTFDFTAKTVVQGSVPWPDHAFTATVSGDTRDIVTNGLPDHNSGTFPIATTDPLYAYDRNPNSIKTSSRHWQVPANPTAAATPTCLSMGPIGILNTGAVLFNALDAAGRDAVAHEAQDACQAHPEMTGEYHYHWLTSCLGDPGNGHSALLGYARDGFGIYGVRGENGEVLTDADLDECHGHTHEITWDGKTVTMYHYHATYEYPYTLGCFKGTPVAQ